MKLIEYQRLVIEVSVSYLHIVGSVSTRVPNGSYTIYSSGFKKGVNTRSCGVVGGWRQSGEMNISRAVAVSQIACKKQRISRKSIKQLTRSSQE